MADRDIQLYELLDGRGSPVFDPAPAPIMSTQGPASPVHSDLRDRQDVSTGFLTNAESTSNAHRSPVSSLSGPSETNPLPNDGTRPNEEQQHLSPLKTTINGPPLHAQADRRSPYLNVIGWWIPEIVASAVSVASFASIVIVLLVYDRRAVAGLDMPSGLTLNGIIALLATIGRVSLCAPVCSGLLQEMWLFFARESKRPVPESRLRDVELFFKASYGTLGSLEFMMHPLGSK